MRRLRGAREAAIDSFLNFMETSSRLYETDELREMRTESERKRVPIPRRQNLQALGGYKLLQILWLPE